MKRLFLAIPINPNIEEVCKEFIDLHDHINTRWIPSKNWHITTIFIGDFPEEKVDDLIKSLDSFFKTRTPFSIELKNIVYASNPRNPRMIWGKFYHSKDFDNLIFKTFGDLKKFYRNNELPFEIRQQNTPHITLTRLRRNNDVPELDFDDPIGLELVVDSCQLFESELTPHGAKYKLLKEFKFSV